MLTLGIDPGTATTGYGFVTLTGNRLSTVHYGTIQTPAHTDTSQRLLTIYKELQGLIAQCRPDALAIESLFFNQNIRTAISVAQARGIILLVDAEHALPVGEYTPPQVKLAVTGYGKADKKQVQQMIKTLLHLETIPKPDDAADALAIGICHAHHAGSMIIQ